MKLYLVLEINSLKSMSPTGFEPGYFLSGAQYSTPMGSSRVRNSVVTYIGMSLMGMGLILEFHNFNLIQCSCYTSNGKLDLQNLQSHKYVYTHMIKFRMNIFYNSVPNNYLLYSIFTVNFYPQVHAQLIHFVWHRRC